MAISTNHLEPVENRFNKEAMEFDTLPWAYLFALGLVFVVYFFKVLWE